MSYYYGKKTMKTWIHEPNRTEGASKLNVEFLRELKDASRKLGAVAYIDFFLCTELGINDVRRMMYSAKKQRTFIYVVCQDLKIYRVDPEWEKVFRNDIRAINRRVDWIKKITKENIRMTEFYPYFESVGWEKLESFQTGIMLDDETSLTRFVPEIKKWNEEHADAIKAHVESVREEKEATERHRAESSAASKAEKEEAKAKKKAEDAYIREMKKNKKAYESRKKKIDRSFEYLWR